MRALLIALSLLIMAPLTGCGGAMEPPPQTAADQVLSQHLDQVSNLIEEASFPVEALASVEAYVQANPEVRGLAHARAREERDGRWPESDTLACAHRRLVVALDALRAQDEAASIEVASLLKDWLGGE